MALDILRAAQGVTCAIIKAECCVYISDYSGSISATLAGMKDQVKSMYDDNLPFWTSVLSWVNCDWWKTILNIVIVVLLFLFCGPCILQCVVNFVSRRLTSFTRIYTRKPKMQYIPMSDVQTGSWENQEGEWRRKWTGQADSILKKKKMPSYIPSELWTTHVLAFSVNFGLCA